MIPASSPSSPPLRPLVILGAARSGTKLVRTLLSESHECAVIPHSLNDLWRSGLPPTAPDQRTASDKDVSRVKAHIRSHLSDLATQKRTSSSTYLVEKTCANTLRVPFVNAVLPDAHFIHIIRDGRDVSVSARRKWTEGPSIEDFFRKLRPPSNLSLLIWHTWNWWSGTDGMNRWGPRYPGMSDDLQAYSLLEVCARQWRICVETCLDALEKLPAERVTTLRYEALVGNPSTLSRLVHDLDLVDSASTIREEYSSLVHQRSVGRWKDDLTGDEKKTLNALLAPTLDRISSLRTLSSA